MASKGKQNLLKRIRQRKYLNKDFQSMRADLLEYARTYYADRINDFSEASMGGVLLDFAAYVGDVTSFYLDHQFSELDPQTAVEDINIERALRASGVDINGSAPAVATTTFFISVPAVLSADGYTPKSNCLPTIKMNTVLVSEDEVEFTLTEDIDFSETDINGDLVATVQIDATDANNNPSSFILSRDGICVSGNVAQETFSVGEFIPFRRITLGKSSVTEILSVIDSAGNEYYEVDSLAQDVVYRGILNRDINDNTFVKENLEVVPAPYRFKTETSLSFRETTLVFGGGSADTLEDDIIPDPSEFAIPLYGKNTFGRFALDPNKLLGTTTLGVIKPNTDITVRYRHGGGLEHNVDANSINIVSSLATVFPAGVAPEDAASVRSSIAVNNSTPASGGDDPLTADELKDLIPSARNSQSRMVTKSDLIARVYTLPTRFGRVFRAGIRSSPNNPLTSQLFIISRNSFGELITSHDSLKKNLSTYLNDYRLISDSIDILDASIINISIDFEIVVDTNLDKELVLQDTLIKVRDYFDIKNFNIDQPIVISDITSVIYNTDGVVAVNGLTINNLTGELSGQTYSGVSFNVKNNTYKNIIVPPPGGIFELKFPDDDIVGIAT